MLCQQALSTYYCQDELAQVHGAFLPALHHCEDRNRHQQDEQVGQ
jgi:hypothetical protein